MQDVSKARHQTQIMGGKQRFSKLFMCACVNVRACETECSCVGVCSIIGGSPTAWQRRTRWGGVGGSLGERTGEREGRGGEQKYGIGESRREKKKIRAWQRRCQHRVMENRQGRWWNQGEGGEWGVQGGVQVSAKWVVFLETETKLVQLPMPYSLWTITFPGVLLMIPVSENVLKKKKNKLKKTTCRCSS